MTTAMSVQQKPCYCAKHELLRNGVDITCLSVIDDRDPQSRSSNYHSGDWCSRHFDEGLSDVSCECGRHTLPGQGFVVKVIWTSVERRVTAWNIRIVVSETHRTTVCAESRTRSLA